MIICAAININFIDNSGDCQELVVCGHRHTDCFNIIKHLHISHKNSECQGFINHKGEFLDRVEAWKHALECGQLSISNRWYKVDHNEDELYSEDLY